MIKSTDRSASWTERLLYSDAWLVGLENLGLDRGTARSGWARLGWNVWDCRLADLRTGWPGTESPGWGGSLSFQWFSWDPW